METLFFERVARIHDVERIRDARDVVRHRERIARDGGFHGIGVGRVGRFGRFGRFSGRRRRRWRWRRGPGRWRRWNPETHGKYRVHVHDLPRMPRVRSVSTLVSTLHRENVHDDGPTREESMPASWSVSSITMPGAAQTPPNSGGDYSHLPAHAAGPTIHATVTSNPTPDNFVASYSLQHTNGLHMPIPPPRESTYAFVNTTDVITKGQGVDLNTDAAGNPTGIATAFPKRTSKTASNTGNFAYVPKAWGPSDWTSKISKIDGGDGVIGTIANTNGGMTASKTTINGRVAYYQIPSNPKGLVAVFPGCERTGVGFWPNSSGCRECTGLTEDVATTKQCLARGYGVVVFTSKGPSLCWQDKSDGAYVKAGPVGTFVKQHKELSGKPVYVWGASSGGGMMLGNLGYMGVPIAGVISVVATSRGASKISPGLKGMKPPPIAWITMSRSSEKASAASNVAGWKKYAPAGMASVEVRPVTDTFFSDRDSRLTPSQSAQITAHLKKLGLIDSSGKVVKDPKAGGHSWVSSVYAAVPSLKTALPGSSPTAWTGSPLLQELFVAQAGHEHVTDYTTAALMWFESGATGDFSQFATKYAVKYPALLTSTRQSGEPTPAAAYAFGVSSSPAQSSLVAKSTATASAATTSKTSRTKTKTKK